MSLAQIEQEIAKLSPEELEHLQAVINALRKSAEFTATPEMLARRREISDKFISGEWRVELEGFEEDQAKDRANNEALLAKWRE